jgi:hypothetical protein
VLLSHDREKVRLMGSDRRISMLAPFTPTTVEVQVESLSLHNESLMVEIVHGTTVVTATVFLPNCEEFSNA